MAQIYQAIQEIDKFESLAKRDQWLNQIHPLVKLMLSIFYIGITVSFPKYSISSLLVMCIYPFFAFVVGELSFKDALRRMKLIFPVICFVGIWNPILDRQPMFFLGEFLVTSGMISMVSLMIKGFLTVLAAYLLIATTTMEDICYSLGKIHIPKTLVIVILLIYRYITLFLTEVSRITTAYHLRAPRQKGINYKAWGSLVGQMLLRSMDRANLVYEAMCLRGFKGSVVTGKRWKWSLGDTVYLLVWCSIIILLRYTSILELVGSLIGS